MPSEGGSLPVLMNCFPTLTMNYFGSIGVIAFFIGVVASTFASIDSCIAALTTSLSYDFFDFEKKSDASKKTENTVLIAVNLVMYLIVLSFWNSEGSIINSIFKVAGYTYGPLLGIFLIGLFTKIKFNEKFVPYMAITAPVLTFGLNYWLESQGFSLGF
ncbi:MAG: hypothetical protein IPO04_19515 [Cytophagaceae bacterium]|nr:hypothetical protein [Cytophagaceae bacterium]